MDLIWMVQSWRWVTAVLEVGSLTSGTAVVCSIYLSSPECFKHSSLLCATICERVRDLNQIKDVLTANWNVGCCCQMSLSPLMSGIKKPASSKWHHHFGNCCSAPAEDTSDPPYLFFPFGWTSTLSSLVLNLLQSCLSFPCGFGDYRLVSSFLIKYGEFSNSKKAQGKADI